MPLLSEKLVKLNPRRKLILAILFVSMYVLTAWKSVLAAETIRVAYVVEYDPLALHTLKINARIQGLPAEALPVELPESHVTDLALSTVEGGEEKDVESVPKFPEASLGRNILLHGKVSEAVLLKFKITLNDRLIAERHSYGDGKRCLIYASDLLLGFSDQNVRSTISFDLPTNWIVVSNIKNSGKDRYLPGAKNEAMFYLGTASRQLNTVGGMDVAIAIEAGWETTKEKWVDLLKRQLAYRVNTLNDERTNPFLVVLLDSVKSARELKLTSLPNASGMVALASMSWLGEADSIDKFQQDATRVLLQCFFPGLRNARDSSVEAYLLDYLSIKTELKTGSITKEQFFQEMATGIGVIADGVNRLPKKAGPSNPKAAPRVFLTREEKVARLFLLDLLLGFYGKSPNSLEQFLQPRINTGILEKLLEGEAPRSLARESGFLVQLETVFPRGEGDISKRLRPFGLVFEKRELADLSFDLDENFNVVRVTRKQEGIERGIMVGDKVLAIGDRKILRPIDLTMVRSEMRPGTDILLLVERDGATLKIKEHVGVESLTKLEANRLSDPDKQEKLEIFLSRDING
ncbi:MAG: hypothetical protein U0V70_13170 [Terriglobia bacterium]